MNSGVCSPDNGLFGFTLLIKHPVGSVKNAGHTQVLRGKTKLCLMYYRFRDPGYKIQAQNENKELRFYCEGIGIHSYCTGE